jgi:hypothetical protein
MHHAIHTAVAAMIPSLLALGGYRYLAAADAETGLAGLCAAAFASAALIAACARTQREL